MDDVPDNVTEAVFNTSILWIRIPEYRYYKIRTTITKPIKLFNNSDSFY